MSSRFVVDLPGQVPSWNQSYRIVHKRAKDRFGQPVFNAKGEWKTYSSMKKTDTVAEYQRMAGLVINTQKPSDFQPGGFLYVLYEFYLGRDIDCDNAMKALGDVLALCLGINDRMFLPVALSKETKSKEPHVRITVLDASAWQVTAQPR